MRKWLLLLLILCLTRSAKGQSAFSVQPLTGERVQVIGGTVFTGSANVTIPTTIFSLTDGAINSIFITNAGVLSIGTSGFGINFPIATVITANGIISSITDNRPNGPVLGSGSGCGLVVSKTANYTAVVGDAGKTFSFNGSNLTFTLPSPIPSATWSLCVNNLNATGLTVSPNGFNLNGSASSLTLAQNQGVTINTDGSNYFAVEGVGGLPAGCTSPGSGQINCTSNISVGTAPTVCGSAAGCWGATAGSTACTPTASQACMRYDSVTGWYVSTVNSGAEAQTNPQLPASSTSNDCVKFSGTTGHILADAGSACAAGSPSSNGVINTGQFYEFDDFMDGAAATGSGVMTGKLGWESRGQGAAATYQSGSWPHVGIVQIDSGATSGNLGILQLTNTAQNGQGPLGALGSNTTWDSHFIFELGQNVAETMELGFTDTPTLIPDAHSSIIIRYLAGTDTKFLFEVCQAGTCTSSSTNSVNVDTSWHNLRIFSITTAGEISFSIDGGLVTCFTAAASGGCTSATTVVNSAHIPTTVEMPMFFVTTSANVDKTLLIDYWGFAAVLTR